MLLGYCAAGAGLLCVCSSDSGTAFVGVRLRKGRQKGRSCTGCRRIPQQAHLLEGCVRVCALRGHCFELVDDTIHLCSSCCQLGFAGMPWGGAHCSGCLPVSFHLKEADRRDHFVQLVWTTCCATTRWNSDRADVGCPCWGFVVSI